MTKAVLLCCAAVLGAVPLVAHASNAQSLELHAAANGVRDAIHERRLDLKRYNISIELRGNVAAVTVDAAFANPTVETLEGDLRLRLPQAAIVSGFALDVGGQMVDGVLVDRPQARAIYDQRVRRGVDPGLGEVVAGNVFETHVHPIWPKLGRRVRIRYVVAIPAEGLRLPVGIDAPGDGWSITVHALGGDAAPVVEMGPVAETSGAANLAFDARSDGYTATLSGRAKGLSGDLVIHRPAQADMLISQHNTGERDVQLGGALANPGLAAPAGPLRIYWDRSRARLSSDIAGDIRFVQKVIEKTRPATVELVAFNSSGAVRKQVTGADEAADLLGRVTYRGATSYAALAADAPVDHCLLLANGGPAIDRLAGFAPRCRLDAASSSARAETAWLHHLAVNHGGGDYALSANNADRVAAAIAAPFAGVVAVLDQDGKALPFVPLDAAKGHWQVLARAPEGGPVIVRIADAGGTHDVVRALDGPIVPFDGVGALIAADRLATLGATEQRGDYVALSRRYGIASPSLSFLVLENPQDYLAARIAPPASYPAEARDAWLRASKARESENAQARAAWQDRVAGEWAQTVTWWHTRFDPQARPKSVTTSTRFDQTVSNAAPPPPVMAPAPAPPPPAPPPAAFAQPSPRQQPLGNIIVTATRRTRAGEAAPEATAEAADNDDTSEKAAAPDALGGATIHIDPWQPERPYLELYDGKPADFDARFLEAEQRHGDLPIFYLDTAEWLRKHGNLAGAREMVLSALELPTANEVTLGMVADRLERYGDIDRAVELRERQAALDPDRPQPRRLLALALARRAALVVTGVSTGAPARARADLTRAVEMLYAIAITPQDERWAGIEMIALNEANALLPRLHEAGGKVDMDPRLVALLDCDMRVVIDWTSDGTDMDLWIDEPDQERAIYNNPRTAIGGHLSTDMTTGFGPEEYLLHSAPPGLYQVQANVFAPDRLDPNGVSLITAHLFHDFGRKTQREESVDVEVKRDDQGSKPIGTMVFTP